MQFENTDPNVSLEIQVGSGHAGPVVMVGTYTTSPDKMDALLESWTVLAHIMRAQPGLLFCQLHRGIGGASVLMNYAVWESLRSEEHTSELQSLMRISYAVFCLKKT